MPDEIQNDSVSVPEVSTPSVAPEAQAAPEALAPAAASTDASGTELGNGEAPPAYAPNLKFKAYNKEYEIEDWARPLITNKEMEDKFRKIHELAYGFNTFKPDYEQLKQAFPEVQQNYTQLHTAVTEILDYRDKGDLDSFFDAVKMPVEKVAEWMLEKINRQNLPPEQRQVYDKYDTAQRNARDQEKQIQGLSERTQTAIAQTRQYELNAILQRPDVSAIASNYDGAQGNQGAFWNLVKQIGESEWHLRQVDLSADEAVKKALALLGPAYANTPTPAMGTPTSMAAEKPLPVIPKFSGRNVSATSRAPRSVEDLKKMYKDMSNG